MSRITIVSSVIIALSIVHIGQSQLRYVTIANSSTMTNHGAEYQMTVQNKNNILFSFKRGSGTTTSDREIRVAYSSDAGHLFKETNITIPANSGTNDPIIASTTSSIVVLYRYDSSGTTRTCRARSTDGGSTFTLSTIYNSHVNSSLETFISDGVSKYYVGDENYLFSSTDNGLTFKEMKLPTDMSVAWWARWAATQNYLWVAYNKSAGDSIYVYRSTDNGNTYQFITRFYNDFSSNEFFTCEAINDQLYLSYVHEEVGTYYLRTRIITGTNVGTEKTVLATTGIYSKPVIKKTTNRIFIGLSSSILQSSDGGSNWSRFSSSTTELSSNPNFDMYVPLDDTTLYLHTDISQGGSLRQTLFANWKWTDFPIPSIKDDTLITNSTYFNTYWRAYVSTPLYRFQMSKNPNFIAIELDTLDDYDVFFKMKDRFIANGTRYYYRLRGEDGAYFTSWSQTKSFRYGSIISDQPLLISPINNSTINYPDIVNFQWSSVQKATTYSFHIAANSSFTDTLTYTTTSNNSNFSFFPFRNDHIINGIFYWRTRGLEEYTGSFGPWSAIGIANYSGAPTSVMEQSSDIPTSFSLSQNYPNPFNPSTVINYSVPKQGNVILIIYDALGREITKLINEEKPAGNYTVEFDAAHLSSGIYFYQLRSGAFIQTKKMLLLR